MPGLEDELKRRTRPGSLYEAEPDGRLHCYACAHDCRIKEGRSGVCRVRFNDKGVLRVPWGYVGALQLDPIEKKPFFHAFPGSTALSFGMLGCDYHCSYCLLPGERVPTESGLLPIESLGPGGPRVYSHTGKARSVLRRLARGYSGPALTVRPAAVPPVRCTPDHPFLVLDPESGRPEFRPALALRKGDLLAVPKAFDFSTDEPLEVAELLRPLAKPYRVSRQLPPELHRRIAALASRGLSSREIGDRVGKSASHVRHLRRKSESLLARLGPDTVPGRVVVEEGRARFSKEHAPGLPARLPWTPELARLLGLFCAEGSVSEHRGRVASAAVSFSFGPGEAALADETAALLRSLFGVRPYRRKVPTGERVSVSKASLGALLVALCGRGAAGKRVPEPLFTARRPIVEAFLAGYARGDGWVGPKGQTTVGTVSEELAWGVAWLLVKLGRKPMLYSYRQPVRRTILGREVRQQPKTHMVRWPCRGKSGDRFAEDEAYWYVPIRAVEASAYEGLVYNLEVAEDHSFLAGFVATHNCQNWVTSQALRDPAAAGSIRDCTPRELVSLALEAGSRVLVSTYNEPLITGEWAVAVFEEARKSGLACAFVSNGNATRRALEALKPWVELYKVDLKGFDDARYRSIMGGRLAPVLRTIEDLLALGFWVEVVTLVIPGVNDSDAELRGIARFLAGASKDLPWHVTAFHDDYKMSGPGATPAATLLRAAELGRAEGLRYVYAGNLPGRVGPWEDTRCPGCGTAVVERTGYRVARVALEGGRCAGCGLALPGRWEHAKANAPWDPRRPLAV